MGLKIDQNFVKMANDSRDYAAIVQAIVTLAKNFGLSLVAEGIETTEQLALLLGMECDMGQGYYFAKPLDNSSASTYLQKRFATQILPVRKAG